MARLFVTLQYLLPHHLLCRIVYVLSRARSARLKNWLIAAFVRRYRPRMDEALEPQPLRYASFNAFFTRALKPAARPIDPQPLRLVSPCDAILTQAGSLQADQLLQAKAQRYSLEALLAADAALSSNLRGGSYATLYLAPYHYHRIHMPLAGRLRAAWHVPGRLFSVNAATVARVPRLFARNERVICAFDGEHGPFALVLVGALFVGSMSTLWHGEITPWRHRSSAPIGQPQLPGALARHASADAPLALKLGAGVHSLAPSTGVDLSQPRGAEVARFNMGSTVILLLPPGVLSWDSKLGPGMAVRVGEALGSLRGP